MKFLKVALKFINLNFQKKVIYRFDFLFTFFAIVAWNIVFILLFKFIFIKVPTIRGLTYDEFFVILMLSELWWFTFSIFARKNFELIGRLINNGNLDLFLLKPVSFRKIIPFLDFDFRHVTGLPLALGLIAIKVNLSNLSLIQILGSLLFLLNGVFIFYSICSIVISFNFWLGRNESAFLIFPEIPEMVRIPIEYFPVVLKNIFIFIFPIITIINPSFQILYNRADRKLLIIAIATSMILFIISEIVWRKGLKAYQGTN